MDAKIKAKWIKALRSGEYKQATGALRVNDSYCCLGVLADLQGADDDEFHRWRTSAQPPSICELVDMNYALELADRNDSGESFEQIADYIKKNL